jgi:RNA polymerase sigma factor (sigma-70 family)
MGCETFTYDTPAIVRCEITAYDASTALLVTMVLDQQLLSPDPDLGEFGAWAAYLAVHRPRFIRIAANLIRRLNVDEANLDGEGAVNLALSRVFARPKPACRATADGDEAMCRMIGLLLKHVVLDERDRERARKRGGTGLHPVQRHSEAKCQAASAGCRRVAAELDGLTSSAASPEEIAVARDELDALVARLGPVAREVLIMRCDALTEDEIADRLGVSRRTVQRHISHIRAVYSQLEGGG